MMHSLLKQAIIAGGIGGGAAIVTDASPVSGATLGVATGALVVGGLRVAPKALGQSLMTSAKPGGHVAGWGKTMGEFGTAFSQSTHQQRLALYGGAGLGGMIFGDRTSKRRQGLNRSRGNAL